jgi:hypothetical protein
MLKGSDYSNITDPGQMFSFEDHLAKMEKKMIELKKKTD